jgi:hypothetical protein
MKVLYMCAFFLNILVISGLAYYLFRGIDDAGPIWIDLGLGIALGLSIALLVLFILHYLQRGSRSDDN